MSIPNDPGNCTKGHYYGKMIILKDFHGFQLVWNVLTLQYSPPPLPSPPGPPPPTKKNPKPIFQNHLSEYTAALLRIQVDCDNFGKKISSQHPLLSSFTC